MLAAVGVYLHRRGFIVGEGKKTLALICQQALIPTYLCVKTMYCEQNQSSKECPDVVKSLNQIWVLLIWPAYVVGMGSLVATIMKWIVKPKPQHIKPMYAATMFGNSTALPITMLTVVHSNFPNKSVLGKVDPTLFLSIYLLLYPVLQWGIGGWLLAPEDDDDTPEPENGAKKTIGSTNNSYGATDQRTRSTATLDTSERVSTIAEESSGAGSGTRSSGSSVTSPSPATDHERIALLRKEEFKSAKDYDQEERNSSNSNKPWVFRNVVNILPTPPSFIRTSSHTNAVDESEQHRKSVSLGDLPGVFPSASGIGIQSRNRSESIGSYGHYTDEQPGGGNTGMDNSQGRGSSDNSNGFGLRRRSSHHVDAYELRLGREAQDPDAIAVNHQTGMVPVDPFVNFVPRHNSMNLVSSYERTSGDNMVAKSMEDQLEQHQHEPTTAAYGTTNFWEMFFKIMNRVFQPPCVGALLGLFITAFPSIRGLFIDMDNRADNAPLEWVYDALLQVGQSSIPIIMIVLGCNLSASQLVEDQTRLLDSRVVVAIILSKMVIMPVIGFTTVLMLRSYVWNIDPEIAPSFYLVCMIVFITPTANNVMVMIELSGSSVKEGVARVIAYQYMLAPFLLSITMAIAVGIAQS